MSELFAFTFTVIKLNPQGEEIERYEDSARHRLEDIGEGVTLEMVAIPGGTFKMGAPETEEGWHSSQSPQHIVTVNSFFISKYPVTQAQWEAVAALPKVSIYLDPEPSTCQGVNRPVDQVSWYEAIEFCARLSQKTGREYRLPSEAQWEYACRACTETPFHFGETITTDLANYSGVNWEYLGKICSQGFYGGGSTGEDRRESIPVGSLLVANQFGLYDMHGNVREWCADHWHNNYEGAPTDGTAWVAHRDNQQRVLRGGSWNTSPNFCRSAYRSRFEADASLYDIGFRVVYS